MNDYNAEEQLINQFTEDFQANRIELPILPSIALRVRNALDDLDIDAAKIARIIQADPSIAMRVIQVANSPAYSTQNKVDNLKEAITRMGFSGVSSVVNSLTLAQLFKTNSVALRNRMEKLWKHSTMTAAISHVIAGMTPGFNPEKALFAGLVHDIGVIPILAYAQSNQQLLADIPRLDGFTENFKGQAGAMLLDRWGFEVELGTVAIESEKWTRNPTEKADYCDLVMLAQIHGYFGKPEFAKIPNITSLPVFKKFPLTEKGPEESFKIMGEAKGQIREVLKLLM